MDIGVLSTRGSDYHPNSRLAAAALAQGFALQLIDPRGLSPGIVQDQLGLYGLGHYSLPLVLLPRQGAEISSSSLIVLSQIQALGLALVNDLASIMLAKNKFLCLQALAAAGIKVPDTIFVNSGHGFFQAVKKLGEYPLVCKKTAGRKGRQVFLLQEAKSAQLIVDKHLAAQEGIILQRFIPAQGRRDYRVLVIGGQVAAAMEMAPPARDFRSNFAISGNSKAVQLPQGVQQYAIKCAQALGLEIAGVDLIDSSSSGLLAIEVNYAPGFKGLEAATGLDIAGMIIRHAVSFFKNSRTRC